MHCQNYQAIQYKVRIALPYPKRELYAALKKFSENKHTRARYTIRKQTKRHLCVTRIDFEKQVVDHTMRIDIRCKRATKTRCEVVVVANPQKDPMLQMNSISMFHYIDTLLSEVDEAHYYLFRVRKKTAKQG